MLKGAERGSAKTVGSMVFWLEHAHHHSSSSKAFDLDQTVSAGCFT